MENIENVPAKDDFSWIRGDPTHPRWWKPREYLDTRLAFLRCQFSALVYGDLNDAVKAMESIGVEASVFQKGNTEAIGLHNRGTREVVFRGTEATSLRDIFTDAQITRVKSEYGKGLIHRGMDEYVDNVWPDIESWLRSRDMGQDVAFSGHSLGADAAIIAGGRVRDERVDVYLYGAARPGNFSYAGNYPHRVRRFSRSGDLVTRMPLPIMPNLSRVADINFFGKKLPLTLPTGIAFWRHVGVSHLIDDNGDVHWEMSRARWAKVQWVNLKSNFEKRQIIRDALDAGLSEHSVDESYLPGLWSFHVKHQAEKLGRAQAVMASATSAKDRATREYELAQDELRRISDEHVKNEVFAPDNLMPTPSASDDQPHI